MDSLVAAIAGFIIILLFTSHGGIGISPDSVVYMSAAENFSSHGKLIEFTNIPVVNFPAGYPFFLSTIMFITGLKPLIFAPYVNASLFGAIIYLSGIIMEKFNYSSKWYKAAILSCIVLSPGLLEDYSMLWSETVFIFLLLLFIIMMSRYLHSSSRKGLIISAIIVSLACITRYVGIVIIATGAILILLNAKLQWRKKIIDLFLFSGISSFFLIINLIRNYHVSGVLTGFRERSITSFSQNLHDAGTVFCDWLPFLHNGYSFATIVAVIIIAGLLILCIKKFLRYRMINYHIGIGAVFSLLYILFMIVSASITRYQKLDSRFFTPVFIPLLWSGSSWIISFYKRSGPAGKKIMIAFGTLIFLGFQYNQLNADAETWDGVKDAGIPGYTEDPWRYSETVQFIQKNPSLFKNNFTIYSDAADAVYFFTGRSGKYLPHKEFKSEIQKFLNDDHCYVIWFSDAVDLDLIDQSFLLNVKKMQLLKQFIDGAIYRFGE